jgi:hypothetical protein
VISERLQALGSNPAGEELSVTMMRIQGCGNKASRNAEIR